MADDTARMQGKIVLISGATRGIGEVTARELARRGASVTIIGRDPARTQATAQAIQAAGGGAAVESIVADLATLAGVRAAAAEFQARHDRLDVLVNNAGAMFLKREVTADGFERTFALNHLSYFLLTNLLLGTLTASAPARVVSVASAAHSAGKIDFDDLQAERHYNGLRQYSTTKLMNLLFTYELARRLAGTGVTANALHPGFVATGFAHNNSPLVGLGLRLMRPIMIGPERGAQTSIYLASSPEVAGVSGQYFSNRKPARSIPASYDETAARKLWEISAQLTGLAVTA